MVMSVQDRSILVGTGEVLQRVDRVDGLDDLAFEPLQRED